MISISDLIVVLLQLLMEVAIVVLVPTFLLRFFFRKLGFWGSFVASWMLIFLPTISFLNNWFLVNSLVESFVNWDVPNLYSFVHCSWGLTTAGAIASVYSGYLLITAQDTSVRKIVLIFLWLSVGFNIFAQVFLPIISFGSFGQTLAKEDLIFLSFYAVVGLSLSMLMLKSSFSKKWFST